MTSDKHNDRFTYRRGADRQRIGRAERIQPLKHESNEDFQRRMDQMAQRLLEIYPDIESVKVDLEYHKGAIVACTIEAAWAPEPAPIEEDARPVARRDGPRGARGRGRSRSLTIGLGLHPA